MTIRQQEIRRTLNLQRLKCTLAFFAIGPALLFSCEAPPATEMKRSGLMPKVEQPLTICILTSWPGHNPMEMEGITAEVEKEMKSIGGVTKIKSASLADISTVCLEINFFVDSTAVKSEVQLALNHLQDRLPPDLPESPTVRFFDDSSANKLNYKNAREIRL